MIEVKNLVKKYGDNLAVSDLSFTIEDGEIYGFLGPNGAGKSTTMNIMTGCLAATSGEVKIGGHDIFDEPKAAKKLIGYLPEMPPLYVDQTPREYLTFVAEAKGISKSERGNAIDTVIEETHIAEVADKLIKHLSKGYRQRVGIAQALLGNPSVIILDEPTVGLDPMQIIEIRDLIKELGKKHTVILSSHILPEVQAICSKILIINKGKLVAFDTPENLSKLSGLNSIELKAEGTKEECDQILKNISGITDVAYKAEDEKTVEAVLTCADDDLEAKCKEIFFAFANEKKAVLNLNPIKSSLEDIFIELTEDKPAEENPKEENLKEENPKDDSPKDDESDKEANDEGSMEA